MYFKAKIGLKPTQDFVVQVKKPTKVFAKIMHTLSAGLVSSKEQAITQTALSLLQQLNICLRSLGITNVVRIARDDVEFYRDNVGLSDDMHLAIDAFSKKMESAPPGLFERFNLTLECADDVIKYLIVVNINRVTRMDELPIDIEVFGLLNAFSVKKNEASIAKSMKAKLSPDPQKFISDHEVHFEQFVMNLDAALNVYLSFEQAQFTCEKRVLRPKNKKNKSVVDSRAAAPIYQDYVHLEGSAEYTWFWLELYQENAWQLSNVYLVDETDRVIAHSDSENYDDRYDDLDEDLSDIEVEAESDTTSESSSWFDSFSSGDSSDGASSCSSCSSCGGD